MPDLSLVIPCRNEAERLPATLAEISRWIGSREAEVVVVVEKGTDRTPEIVEEASANDSRFRLVANPVARGKGYAVRTGMLKASGDIIFFMDADLSVPLKFVELFLPSFKDGADVAFGSRQHPESKIVRSQPIRRVLAGRLFNLCLRMAGATTSHDTQCGFKAFRHQASREIFSRATIDGFGFDVEILALAGALGFRTVELPVEWCDAPGSKVQALQDGAKAFAEALHGAHLARQHALENP